MEMASTKMGLPGPIMAHGIHTLVRPVGLSWSTTCGPGCISLR